MGDFAVEVQDEGETRAVVVPRGELDLMTHQELARAITRVLEEGRVHIVVDLSDTTFMDSTSLGTLIGARRRTHALGGSFALRCREPRLLRLFEVTSLDKVFEIQQS